VAVGVDQTIEVWQPDDKAATQFTTVLDGAHTEGIAHWLTDKTVYGLPVAMPVGEKSAVAGPASEWDAATGKQLGALLDGPQPPAPFLSETIVNRDGTLAARAQGDTVELWDLRHRGPAAVINTGQDETLPTWDPAKQILATTGLGGSLKLWDTSDAANPRLLAQTTVAGPCDRGIIPGQERACYPVVRGDPTVAHFSPDGRTIAMQSALSRVTALVSVPDAGTRHLFRAPVFTDGAVFTSDSKTLATVELPFTGNAQVVLRDVATGNERARLTLPYPEAGPVAFVNGDRWLVTTQSAQIRAPSADQVMSRVDVWDVKTLQPVGEPIMVRGDAGAVEVNRPGGSRLVSSSTAPTAGTYMIWDFDPAAWMSTACSIAGRNLTQSEWKEYLGDRPYQQTCREWPPGP
jgi:WD40 repeat protein